MPIQKFQEKGKWGMKNNSNLVIVEPIYDSLIVSKSGSVVSKQVYDKETDIEKTNIYLIDNSGDIIVDIGNKLNNQNIDNVIEYWQLNEYLFGFQFSNYDSLELTGVFNEKGEIIINPEYDEIELISENLLLCFHGEHYEEFDSLGNKNYGNKLYNIFGDKIEGESIKNFEEFENGVFLFETISKRKFKTNKFGRLEK